MNWDAIGAIGEVIGAIAVFVTLVYLAIQLRRNTKALKSATFQNISTVMAQNVELLATSPTIPALLLKAQSGLNSLTPEERVQFGGMAMMAVRHVEAVYIQELLGSIDGRLTSGFKRSSISSLAHTGFLEWWEIAQRAFSQEFVS